MGKKYLLKFQFIKFNRFYIIAGETHPVNMALRCEVPTQRNNDGN